MMVGRVDGKSRQRQVFDSVEDIQRRALMNSSDEAASRLTHCSLPRASIWLTVLPVDPAMAMSDAEFRAALRLRLGMGPIDYPWRCVCNKSMIVGDHFHSCPQVYPGASKRRHDHIARCIRDLGVLVGSHVKIEPVVRRPYAESKNEVRCDVHLVDCNAFVDVSVVHPECSSYRSFALKIDKSSVSALVRTREASKQHLWSDRVAELDADFFPFVVESHGGWGEKAVELVERLVRRSVNSGFDQDLFRKQAIRRICVAIQRGNALLSHHGLNLCRAAVGSEPLPAPFF